MTEAYFIDSLDARAGLAFASYRSADLSNDDVDVDLPSVFIGPPMFRPERVSSRGIAFAASRGSFQLGLYVDGAEVAFPTLEDVIEFVRRAYLRGGGGDGAGGIGPGVPQIPGGAPERGGPLPVFDFEGEGVLGGMLQYAQLIAKMTHSVDYKPGEPYASTFHKVPLNYPPGRSDSQALAFGAVEIILELVDRFPVMGSDEELLKWFASAERLGHAISKMRLWRPLAAKPWHGMLDDAGLELGKRISDPVLTKLGPVAQNIRASGEGKLLVVFLLARTSDLPVYWYRKLTDFFFNSMSDWSPFITRYRSETDPVDDLANWPLSRSTTSFVGAAERNRASVYDLFSAVLGSPGVLAKGDDAARRAAALVVFAATHIATFANPVVALGPTSGELADAALSESVRTALDWLAEQFPARVFPAQIEALIASASALRYAYWTSATALGADGVESPRAFAQTSGVPPVAG
jgi:hypothetical protein